MTKKLAQEGNFEEIAPDHYVKYYATLHRIAKDCMKKPEPLEIVCGLWIHGATGSGKTHAVVTQHPNRYIKPLNKWWDGYQNEDVVHIDEICPEHAKWIASFLKLWGDKWPFAAEVKGGAKQIRPKLVVITSNYTIEQMNFSENDLPAIIRRYRQVEKFRDQDIFVR